MKLYQLLEICVVEPGRMIMNDELRWNYIKGRDLFEGKIPAFHELLPTFSCIL